jgi:hypothetical protein
VCAIFGGLLAPAGVGCFSIPDFADAAPREMDAGDAAPPYKLVTSNVGKHARVVADDAGVTIDDVTMGDTLIVCFDYDSPTVPEMSVTDSLNNEFALATGGTHSVIYIYWANVTNGAPDGGADTVSILLNGDSMNYIEVLVFEYSGLTGFLDGNKATGTSVAQDGMDSGPLVTGGAKAMIFGYGQTGAGTVGTGFQSVSSYDGLILEDRYVTGQGPYRATGTAMPTDGGSSWIMAGAAFSVQ